MTCIDPVARGTRDEALFELPHHELVARVTAPQRSVSIEHSYLWIAFENQPLELLGCPFRDF